MESKKDVFLKKVLALEKKADHLHILTTQQYDLLIKEVHTAKQSSHKTSLQRRRMKRFDIVTLNELEKLVTNGKKSEDKDQFRYVASLDETFEILDTAHKDTGHGGRDHLRKHIHSKYSNITVAVINIYLSLCEACHAKKSKKRTGVVVKPIVHSHMNSRCQVDLIDMQTQPSGEYKFILVYQDHLTKFVQLRPIKRKTAKEVASVILSIFLQFNGAPCILQSDNGREFSNQIVEQLKVLWPGLSIVHGKPRHSQSQGSVERANQDIENMLATWLFDNQTTNWANGIQFVQFQKNTSLHRGISDTPYNAMFGQNPQVALLVSSTSLPREVWAELNTEEDLKEYLQRFGKDNSNDNEMD